MLNCCEFTLSSGGMGTSSHFTQDLGLATDLYQLTMAAAYHAGKRFERATFELFVRRLPPNRSYLVVAGLEQALDYLTNLEYDATDIEFLRSLKVFRDQPDAFFDYLAGFRFSGDVEAMPEGTIAFPNEPLIRITAPIIEAQVVETFLLATINFQTLIASKAARIVDAASGRGVVEFGGRRAQTMAAALFGARAAFIAGCIGTSNVEAAKRFGIPVFGTAAHSFVMSYANEAEAFEAYFHAFPEDATFLLDTYDTLRAAELAAKFGKGIKGVRLDSGDIGELAVGVRKILDHHGLNQTRIMASGDLNEEKIVELLEGGAPIDLFGVGTEIATSYDAPALSGVYKLVEIEREGRFEPVMKLSDEKSTYPYAKQVWRFIADDDTFVGDLIAAASEQQPDGDCVGLLKPVMRQGKPIGPQVPVDQIQRHALSELARLPDIYRKLKGSESLPVRHSEKLDAEKSRLGRQFGR